MVGVDDQVDVQVLFVEEGKKGGIFRIPHAGDLLGNLVLNPGHQAGNHVHFIAVGDRNQHGGLGDSRLAQQADGPSASMDGLDVQGVLNAPDFFQVAVDDHDVFFFPGEALGQMVADFTCSDNDDAHGPLQLLGSERLKFKKTKKKC